MIEDITGAPREFADEGPVWLSVGDLMAALLLMFVLLFIANVLRLQEVEQKATERRQRVIAVLTENLGAESIEVKVDQKSGELSISNDLLFGFASARLSSSGEELLERFIPVFADVLFSDPEIDEEVVRIIVEGHASREGSDRENLNLSLDRAQAVTDHIMAMEDFDYRDHLLRELLPSGRGEFEADQAHDNPDDRRVTFRFQFRGAQWELEAQRLGAQEVL